METLNIALLILIAVFPFGLAAYYVYDMKRIDKAAKFRRKIIDYCSDYIRRDIYKNHRYNDRIYDEILYKYTLEEMARSRKPLELESFYTQEEIDKLLYEHL